MCLAVVGYVVIIRLKLYHTKVSDDDRSTLVVLLYTLGAALLVGGGAYVVSGVRKWVREKTSEFGQAVWPILTTLQPRVTPQAFPESKALKALIWENLIDLAAYKIAFDDIDGCSGYRARVVYQEFKKLFEGSKAFEFIPEGVDFEIYFSVAKSGRAKEVKERIVEDDQLTQTARIYKYGRC